MSYTRNWRINTEFSNLYFINMFVIVAYKILSPPDITKIDDNLHFTMYSRKMIKLT